MNNKPKKQIYRKTKSIGMDISQVCEVGVYLPETSNIIDYINEGVTTMLVEPEPKSIAAIEAYFKEHSNITLYPFAIYNRSGKLTLARAEASTFAAELPSSPALVNDHYQLNSTKNIEVDCKLFSSIDPGNIDLLSIDTEGSEWHVLSTMSSRPRILSIETHGKYYINPYISEINNWLSENNYHIWFKDQSDTVYFHKDSIKLSLVDHFNLFLRNTSLWLRRSKRYFFR